MSGFQIFTLLAAGLVAGAVNAIVGSGSLLTFPALLVLIPPFLEWRKAKKQGPRNYTQAQVDAEAASLHNVVDDD